MCARDLSQDRDRLEHASALEAADDELDYAVVDRVYEVGERPARTKPAKQDKRER